MEQIERDSRRGLGRFNAYVAPARNGKATLWRLALGLVLVAAVWLVGTLGIVVVGAGGVVLREGLDGNSLDAIADRIDGEWLFRSPSGTCLVLGSFVAMWAGVWLALRVLHGRSTGSALGAERRLDRADFGRAAVAAFALGVVHIPVVWLIEPTLIRGQISLLGWLLALLPVIAFCFVQTSAEEVLFRGYLQQQLAARFATPAVWLGFPTVLFTLLHWDVDASRAMNLAVVAEIGAFALAASYLVVRTGNLGAAMGVHFGHNITGFLFFSSEPLVSGASLFHGRPVADADWAPEQALMLGLTGMGAVLVVQWLLLHHASPLRLPSLSRPVGEDGGLLPDLGEPRREH